MFFSLTIAVCRDLVWEPGPGDRVSELQLSPEMSWQRAEMSCSGAQRLPQAQKHKGGQNSTGWLPVGPAG